MKERLLEFLRNENKSSAQLAEEIGVQASGISHILSGRNNPSLDFVLKMLDKYQFLSTDWLLFGKGPMYKESKMQNLFEYDPDAIKGINEDKLGNIDITRGSPNENEVNNNIGQGSLFQKRGSSSEVIKIVWFYGDKSFDEYYPHG